MAYVEESRAKKKRMNQMDLDLRGGVQSQKEEDSGGELRRKGIVLSFDRCYDGP